MAGAQRRPGLFAFVARVRLPKLGQPVDPALVGRNVARQCLGPHRQVLHPLHGRGVFAPRLAALGGEQLVACGFHRAQQRVARGGRQLAQGIAQHLAQVLGRVAHGLGEFVRGALPDPQQPWNAHVLGGTGPLARKAETQQLREMVFGRGTVQRGLAFDVQLAAPLAQEGLEQAVAASTEVELQLDGGRGSGVAPGPQVFHAARAVALEKGGAHGLGHRALAGLVGRSEQVQPVGEVFEHQRRHEALEVFQAQATQLHGRPAS